MQVVSKSLAINLLEIIEGDAALMTKLCEVDQAFKGTSNETQALSNLKTIQRIKETLESTSFEASISFESRGIA